MTQQGRATVTALPSFVIRNFGIWGGPLIGEWRFERLPLIGEHPQ